MAGCRYLGNTHHKLCFTNLQVLLHVSVWLTYKLLVIRFSSKEIYGFTFIQVFQKSEFSFRHYDYFKFVKLLSCQTSHSFSENYS